jgi:meso-butanediol dehydrogenase / (S,S)-butanediol dehydrogenase / diacetyl reductase
MSAGGEPATTAARGWYDGRVAIVTGASMGIGRAIARRLAREGASLVLTALEEDILEAAARECRSFGVAAAAMAGDLEDEGLPDRLMALARERFGGVDVVINNAFWEERGSVVEVSLRGWDRTLRVTLTAAMLTARAALPSMVERGGGSIINVSSMRAIASGHGAAAYEAAKAGLLALTRSVAVDFGKHGIRSNCILPGLVLSERARAWYQGAVHRRAMDAHIPRGRPAEPDEIANVVAFVGSPEASYMNGSIVWVDGGALAGLPENVALELSEQLGE